MNNSCDVYELFGVNANTILKGKPIGYVYSPINDDPIDLGSKIEFWGIRADPNNVSGCAMYLVKFLDGSAVAVRYRCNHVFLIDVNDSIGTPYRYEVAVIDSTHCKFRIAKLPWVSKWATPYHIQQLSDEMRKKLTDIGVICCRYFTVYD